MDITRLQSLRQDYARSSESASPKANVSTILEGRTILAGEAVQARHETQLAQLEDELMACVALKDEVEFFQNAVRTMLRKLKIQPKPLTARQISEAIGELIEELEPQTPQQSTSVHEKRS